MFRERSGGGGSSGGGGGGGGGGGAPSTTTTAGSTLSGAAASSSSLSWQSILTGRIATLVYLKAVLTGRTPYASLVTLSQRDLQAVYDCERMRKRSHRHMALGVAIASLIDGSGVNGLTDLARGTLAVFNEVDALPENYGVAAGSGSAMSAGGAAVAVSGPMASLGLGSRGEGGRGMVGSDGGARERSERASTSACARRHFRVHASVNGRLRRRVNVDVLSGSIDECRRLSVDVLNAKVYKRRRFRCRRRRFQMQTPTFSDASIICMNVGVSDANVDVECKHL